MPTLQTCSICLITVFCNVWLLSSYSWFWVILHSSWASAKLALMISASWRTRWSSALVCSCSLDASCSSESSIAARWYVASSCSFTWRNCSITFYRCAHTHQSFMWNYRRYALNNEHFECTVSFVHYIALSAWRCICLSFENLWVL